MHGLGWTRNNPVILRHYYVVNCLFLTSATDGRRCLPPTRAFCNVWPLGALGSRVLQNWGPLCFNLTAYYFWATKRSTDYVTTYAEALLGSSALFVNVTFSWTFYLIYLYSLRWTHLYTRSAQPVTGGFDLYTTRSQPHEILLSVFCIDVYCQHIGYFDIFGGRGGN